MSPGEIEMREAERCSDPMPESADDESTSRIRRYARVLAPSQRGAKAVAMSNVLATAREAYAIALNPGDRGCVSAPGSSVPSTVCRGDGQAGAMMKHICEVGDFVRRLRIQARLGEFSRAPLCLLRVELCGEYAECDWVARPPDPWDADLSLIVGKRNASTQALHDAIKVRDLLFRALPDLQKAELRGYRYSPGESLELILSGTVSRDVRLQKAVRSLAMQAKLLGLQFSLANGVLENLQPEVWAASS